MALLQRGGGSFLLATTLRLPVDAAAEFRIRVAAGLAAAERIRRRAADRFEAAASSVLTAAIAAAKLAGGVTAGFPAAQRGWRGAADGFEATACPLLAAPSAAAVVIDATASRAAAALIAATGGALLAAHAAELPRGRREAFTRVAGTTGAAAVQAGLRRADALPKRGVADLALACLAGVARRTTLATEVVVQAGLAEAAVVAAAVAVRRSTGDATLAI